MMRLGLKPCASTTNGLDVFSESRSPVRQNGGMLPLQTYTIQPPALLSEEQRWSGQLRLARQQHSVILLEADSKASRKAPASSVPRAKAWTDWLV